MNDFARAADPAAPMAGHRNRIVLAKVGLDGHDRGIKVVARGLRDAGFHVIYGGIWQSPAAVAQAVADEDADWLGISLLNGAHMTLIPLVLDELRRCGCDSVGVVLGGIIPDADVSQLKALGVAASFGPGTPIAEIVTSLNSRPRPSNDEVSHCVERCRQRDRQALSRLLSRLANGDDIASVRTALAETSGSGIDPKSTTVSRCRTIAFTGSAGVGKSSLIARLLTKLLAAEHRVAVLSCDPQSPITGGALLGDRVRMAGCLPDERVLIRSLATPSGSQGIAPHLDLMVRALELFGFDIVLIETVGTGQGDVAVRDIADTVVVLLQPESGDAVQWEKAGLLEVADVVVIHKSDLPGADRMEAELREHLHLPGCRAIPLVRVSAAHDDGVEQLWQTLRDLG